jgi:hypothetical protein
MTQSLAQASIVSRRRMPPDDAGVLRLTSNIGYALADSLSDLVDNSIDAGARNVLIRVYKLGDRLVRVAVIDDGQGMEGDDLREAMRLGRSNKPSTSLGKYGIGLKAASLSHAGILTVASRTRHAAAEAVRYTVAGIEDGWKLDVLDSSSAAELLDQTWITGLTTFDSGTVVLWDSMSRFAAADGSPTRRFGQLARRIVQHLGLHFHRFIDDGLSIAIDLFDEDDERSGLPRTVEALNPFPTRSGHAGYPATFHTRLAHASSLDLDAHIWPPSSREPGYNLDGRAAQRQGFYFYRNDRLIQAGGWNGWRNNDAEPHLSLARVKVDLSPDAHETFGLNAQKNGIVVPPDFIEGLTAARAGQTTMADYIRVADEVYRSGHRDEGRVRAMPGTGTSAALRKALGPILLDRDDVGEEIAIRWVRLAHDRIFEIDHDARELLLNLRFRSDISPGETSRNDAPLVKLLLFLLVGDDALRDRASGKLVDRHAKINNALLAALTHG